MCDVIEFLIEALFDIVPIFTSKNRWLKIAFIVLSIIAVLAFLIYLIVA